MSVDGTDFPIQEPKPFSLVWCSHKFRGSGLRYEVIVSIQTGWIVWINGPYPAGTMNDLHITQEYLHQALLAEERYVADQGYYGKQKEKHYAVTNHTRFARNDWEMDRSRVRARHECINSRFKVFSILKRQFRHHSLEKHKLVTFCVANILQIKMEYSGKNLTWNCHYYQPTIAKNEIVREDKKKG